MRSISDEIYISIEAQIVNGELKTGDKLPSENELCKLWNTSRITVRQALERMTILGILKKVRGGGTYVSEPDSSLFLSPLLAFAIFREETIENILVFRSILDVGSVRLCAENRTQENLNNLAKCLDDMERNYRLANRAGFNEGDLEFHMEIARGSQNPLNVKFNEMLRHVVRKNQITINDMLGASTSLKEHNNIFIAIEDRDAELATHFMRKHIQRTFDEVSLRVPDKK